MVVSYTDDAGLQNSKTFLELGLQTAAGVPLQCDEGDDFRTFRIGLFGLEKLGHIERTVGYLDEALRRSRGNAKASGPRNKRSSSSAIPGDGESWLMPREVPGQESDV